MELFNLADMGEDACIENIILLDKYLSVKKDSH
jgi:hypothetical protein